MSDNDGGVIRGLGVSPGICRGRAVVLSEMGDDEQEGIDHAPVILVGHHFSAEDVLSMDAEAVCGFVMESGGQTASAGIVAHGVGLPAVIGCLESGQISSGDFLIIDGTRGEVYLNPAPDVIAALDERIVESQIQQEALHLYRHLPPETSDGWKVDLLGNVDLVDAAPTAIINGASGIGLFRSEFYYLTEDGAPSEAFLFSLYQHLLSSIAPLPVTIRTLDLSDGAMVHGLDRSPEANPALGLKGVRFSLQYPDLFKIQLRALYRASAFGKLRIVLPMVSGLDALIQVKTMIEAVKDDLTREGVAIADDVELGVLFELPSAAFVARELAAEVDFFSIAINDLLQYGLGLDRSNATVSHDYDPLDPGILRMIQQVIGCGHEAGIDVGMCGEMAGDPCYTPLLIGLAVDHLSMPGSRIAAVKKVIRESSLDGCAALVHRVLQQGSAQVSKGILLDYLAQSHPDLPGVSKVASHG